MNRLVAATSNDPAEFGEVNAAKFNAYDSKAARVLSHAATVSAVGVSENSDSFRVGNVETYVMPALRVKTVAAFKASSA